MKRTAILTILALLTFIGLSVTAYAHNNDCTHNCGEHGTPTPHGTKSPTPTVYPCDQSEPCDTPTATPSATPVTQEPTPVTIVTDGPPSAPQLPSCVAPVWAPTVTYDGQIGDTFTYHWTTVKDNVHTYFVNYGATPKNLPYWTVVQGESTSLTMYGIGSNWMRVAGVDNGCIGPFSQVVN